MNLKEFINYVENKIYPFKLQEKSRSKLATLFRKHSKNILIESVDDGVNRYFEYDNDGKLIRDSVENFLNKLGGIAYNKSKNPIDNEISRLKYKCEHKFYYWDETKADIILNDYIVALHNAGYNDKLILKDLQNDVNNLINRSPNWSYWYNSMLKWLEDIKKWDDDTSIKQNESILPTVLFAELSPNFQSICKQINSSYENNLYDCTAVMMRRLLESLLVLSFQYHDIESEIMDKDGTRHVMLDKIIKKAEQSTVLCLSANTKKDLMLFKDLGNYSAHKIWYNCIKHDIEPNIYKYRVIIEELIYKAGLR